MKKKSTLNTKFVIIMLLALTILFVVVLAAVQVIAQIFVNNYVKNDVQSAQQTANGEVTDVLNEINFGYTRMVQSKWLEEFSRDVSNRQQTFKKMVDDAVLSQDYLNVVLCVDDNFYATNDQMDLPAKSFLKKIAQGNVILYLGEINSDAGYVQIGRKFTGALYGLNGYVVFYLDVSVLNSFCAITTPETGYTMLMTQNYQIVSHSQGVGIGQTIVEQNKVVLQQGVSNVKVNGQNCYVAVTPMDNQYSLNLFFVSVLNRNVLQKNFNALSVGLAGIAALCMLVALVFAFRMSRFTTAPVKNLSNKISSVDFQHKLGLEIGSEGDELYELERNYEEMLQRLFRLMQENKDNMETQRKLEIEALQMQINPHFLYNTLDAIAWMAKIKKQTEIEKLVINLAKFFRISLHKGDKFVTVREETELIEHFLEIEKIRFPDTINYVCNVPQDIADYKTLKLILQPIVENSIKHGFSGKEGVGTITITAKTEGDDLVISVTDDGCGFEVVEGFWKVKTDKPNGFGLYNVHERLVLEYGEGYGLDITSQVGVGTTVNVKIKKRL